ncbi:MAG: helix-turn-helix transcriptional regulator [Bacteroidota bacterium]|nr:helix-turn-helix transcriptional regulator [Bacteroidota bacterium]
MLFMLVFLSINALDHLGYYNIYQYLYIIQLPVLLAVLPTFHLYAYALFKADDFIYTKHPIIYYLPAFFVLLLNSISFIGMEKGQFALFYASRFSIVSSQDIMVNIAVLVFFLGGAVFILMQLISSAYQFYKVMSRLHKYKQKEKIQLDHLSSRGLKYIFFSVYVFVLLSALMVLFNPGYYDISAMLYNVLMIVCGGLAGYFGLTQNTKLQAVANAPLSEMKIIALNYNENSSGESMNANLLDSESSQELIHRLRSFVSTEKPYTKSDLSIGELAKSLHTSKRILSWLLNKKMNTNFYRLMNKYRVLEAKELLKRVEYRNLKMDEIARMAGFKSKSSFNNAFRELTGQTPSEYRNCKKENAS